MTDQHQTTTTTNEPAPREWTLWVFAGPQALSGLYEDENGLGLVETRAGDKVPIEETLARALGGKPLPAGVRIILETVGEPTLLQRLTREWPSQRMIIQPEQSVANATLSAGQRDLGGFIKWAMDPQNTPPGSRRALILLGDVLRAIGDEPPEAVDLGAYRPGYPKGVVITKASGDATWAWGAANWTLVSGTTNLSPTYGQTWSAITGEGSIGSIDCDQTGGGDHNAPTC